MALARGTLFAGDFQILDDRPLSEGGMGAVYVVEQVSTGKRRALKLMLAPLVADKKLRERFVQEARVGGKIESAHVVDVVSAGIEEATGTPWLCMELLEGADLGKRVEERGRLEPAEALEIFEQLCHAVGAAHAAGIVHRDLKPENIFLARSKEVSGRSVVKVLDFGIAKIVAEAATKRTGAMGTPLWMAPEQSESGVVDATADVWALGLIAFYVLTGRCFWKTGNRDETSVPQIMREVLFGPIPLASLRAMENETAGKLPSHFDEWFARCVDREPGKRFATATLAFEALESVLSAPVASEPPVTVPTPPTDPVPTPRLLAPPVPTPLPPMMQRGAIDRTVLAVSSPPPRPANVHGPTPPPTMLTPRPAGRSPLIFGVVLAALLIGSAIFVYLSRYRGPPTVAVVPVASATESASGSPPDVPVAVVAPLDPLAPKRPPPPKATLAAGDKDASVPVLPEPDAPKTEPVVPVVPVVPASDAAFASFKSVPRSRVTLDGKPIGSTPLKVQVTPGPHIVTFELGTETIKKRFKVSAGETKQIGAGEFHGTGGE